MKNVVILGLVLTLAGCGGAKRFKNNTKPAPSRSTMVISTPYASGTLSNACMASDRKARSRQLCGCVQSVADQYLSNGDQARAAKFYNDPQMAQDIRQSDRASDERFWKAYSDYAKQAAATCR
ncbi:hypothetical protein OO012_05980 [Rhodobacteraceae bacterium KMM 6894]|nr:hypothetical protein [Rhodobacteraceae bacterium KMM 6894]